MASAWGSGPEEEAMTIEQREALRDEVRSLTLGDVKDNLVTVAERYLAHWLGDSGAARASLAEMRVNGELAGMLGLAMDTVEHRRQRRLNRELDGLRVRRGRW